MQYPAVIEHLALGPLNGWRLTCGDSSAVICAQGAQVMEYGVSGEPSIVWRNPHAAFTPMQPIRGGIPICWPWFAALQSNPHQVQEDWEMENAPFHGLVRQIEWTLEHQHQGSDSAAITVQAPINPNGVTARVHVKLENLKLELKLELEHTGTRPIAMSSLLHSYFAVSSVANVSIHGLAGAHYVDNLLGGDEFHQSLEPQLTCPIERVYQGVGSCLTIEDIAWARRIIIEPINCASAVLWNPGSQRATELDQFSPEAWSKMICFETGRLADDILSLAPGEQASIGVRISRELLNPSIKPINSV